MEGYKKLCTWMAILLTVSSLTVLSNSKTENHSYDTDAAKDIPITVL